MKIIKTTLLRVLEGILDSFKVLVSTACNLLAVMLFALVLHFVPTFVVLAIIFVILSVTLYFTYKDELEDIDEIGE